MTKQPHTVADDLRTIRRLIFGAIAVVVVIGFVFYQSATSQTRDIIRVRSQSRYTQCLRDNDIRLDAGNAAAKKAQDFIDSNRRFYHTPPATGALLQAEKDYVASQRQVTLEAYPHRDCSKAGIDAYYKNPPPPDPDPCHPDGKGLCK